MHPFWIPPIVVGMRARAVPRFTRLAPALLAFAVVCACTAEEYDWRNRSIPWTYGPTTGGATAEHLAATGKKGDPIAKGWQWRLTDGRQLGVQPYELAKTHPMFGKVAMNVGLFDTGGKQIGSVRSAAITADAATFSFELEEAVGKALHDVVIWYVGS
ncbi:MAG: hypothetical protein KDE27_19035 [Planctomycetes bacterium]|nr:hypothetical protein [Planctomycetota bacterium]